MNDWIVANINNPEFSVADFHNVAEMDVSNTQMLSKQDYLNSDYIKKNPLFLDENGSFSEDKFNNYYNLKLSDFLKFLTGKYSGLELDMFDTDITSDTPIRDNHFYLGQNVNPNRQKVGIEGVNIWSAPEFSVSELAETLKVFDTETGEYRDYSPNDKALTSNPLGWISLLFADPLVLATWDEDGTHIDPITKREVKHKKGENKLNDNGTYYYETLNGRSPIGKQVLSSLDTLTVDGKGINKYDFFDSDDIEKSIPGVIAKNVMAIAPLFLGPVGEIYSAALVGREIAKSLPMVYNMTTALITDSDAPKWMNTIAAKASLLTSSTSDYAKEHTFAFENFGNLIADVALQWGQQKAIAKTITKLRGSKDYVGEAMKDAEALYKAKAAEFPAQAAESAEDWMNSSLGQACIKKFLPAAQTATKNAGLLGRDASLAYMALVSNTDVYEDMRDRGLTKKEASAIAFGSTLGMFAVDKFAGIGELFFDDATEDFVKQARLAVKNEIKAAGKAFEAIKHSSDLPTNKLLKLIKTGADATKRVMSNFSDDLKYHMTGFLGKSIGEGLEEVSEELVTDSCKQLYQLAGAFGFNTTTRDVGAWDNAFDRYAMSFLGGAVGGATFYGKELVDGKSFKRPEVEMATLIRNGHANDLREQVEDLRKHGKLGSKKLSAVDYEIDKDGNAVWLTTTDSTKSQNDAVGNLIKDKINTIDTIINNNQLNLTDDDLFKQMVLSEERYWKYKSIAPATNYYEDFNNVMTNIIKAELDYKQAMKTIDGTPEGAGIPNDTALNKLTPEEKTAREANIQKALDNLTKARLDRDNFISGDTSLDYTRKLNFAMDPILHSQFLKIDIDQLWKEKFGDKTISEVSKEDLQEFYSKTLPEARLEGLKKSLPEAWERYKAVEGILSPIISEIAETSSDYKDFAEKFSEIVSSKEFNDIKKSYVNFDTKLDTESDEDFENRNKRLVDPVTGDPESDEEFRNRYYNRVRQLADINDLRDQEQIDKLNDLLSKIGFRVDPITKLQLQRKIETRVKDVIRRKILEYNIPDIYRSGLKQLKNDLSNVSEISDLINKSKIEKTGSEVKDLINKLYHVELESGNTLLAEINIKSDEEGEEYALNEFDPSMNPDSLIASESPEKIKEILDIVDLLQGYLGGDVLASELNLFNVDSIDHTTYSSLDDGYANLKQFILNRYSYADSQFSGIINNIKNNAIVKFSNSLDTTLINPVDELFKTLAGKTLDGKEAKDAFELLLKIQSDAETIDDIQDLTLDETKIKTLQNTKDILSLVSTYLYAASSTSNLENPIGHNKMINEFARNHKDVVRNWKELPEIDSDYSLAFNQALVNYLGELEFWINLSNRNRINKSALFVRGDEAFQKAIWETYQDSLPKFHVKVDDKEYDLLEGISSIDTGKVDTDEVGVPVYNVEKLLYSNFLKALKDSGLTITEFLEKTQLFDKLVDLSNIKKLNISAINADLKSFTDYDKFLYFASVLTQNPATFYNYIKKKIDNDHNIAPITSLEYGARLALAGFNQQFRDIISYGYKKSGSDKLFLSNTTIITGGAGAGKTSVVVKHIADCGIDKDDIIACGPTETQYTSLGKSLNVNTRMTIDELMVKIVGEATYNELRNAYNTPTVDNPYFELSLDKDDFSTPILKDTAPITFLKLDKIPRMIVIDEATHLNSISAAILNNYMKSVGGELILVGDPRLLGYSANGDINNIRKYDVFAVRTPRLTTSLRDNNIQKQENLDIVGNTLDETMDLIEKHTASEFGTYFPNVLNAMSKFNLRVFNGDEINGDLITSSLDTDLIKKLKTISATKTVGFIGPTTSSTLSLLKAEGINPVELSVEKMQGLEFDYVVIDHNFDSVNDLLGARKFLLTLYTLMSRGKEAAIFIDRGLSNIIGKNNISEYQAKAPSLNDKIDGKSAIDRLIEKKLNVLNLFDLSNADDKLIPDLTTSTPSSPASPTSPTTSSSSATTTPASSTTTTTSTSSPVSPTTSPDSAISPTDFHDPETSDTDKKLDEFFDEEFESEIEDDSKDTTSYASSEFDLEGYGDVTFIGAEEGEEETVTKDGKEYKGKSWVIKFPTDGPLRNCQALFDPDEKNEKRAFWYSEKIAMQNRLYTLKSILLYNHTMDEEEFGRYVIDDSIRNKFRKEDWENGEYAIEIRQTDELTPIGGLKEVGLEWNGKRYIVNLVFKVKNKAGRECIFDICGLNNPRTLINNLSTIKNNLNERIAKATGEEKTRLTNIRDTIDTQASKYKDKFQSWIDQFESDGKFYKKIPSSMIRLNLKTWFKKRSGSDIRLDGYRNPNETGTFDSVTFTNKNPGYVISKVYVYSGKNNYINVDLKISGKAVIFVSDDMTLSPDDLPNLYVQQKQNPELHTPRVRMIKLNNYGITMGQMCDLKFLDEFAEGKESALPFRQNYLGISMFVSMWNFNAAMLLFKDKYDEWVNKNHYDSNKVTNILEAQNYLYRNSTISSDERARYLSGKSVTESDLENLNKFNLEDLKDIPTFRLGASDKNGFHILQFSVGNCYDTDKANLLVIDPETLNKFQSMMRLIIDPYLTSEVGLGLKLYHDIEEVDGKKVKKNPWDKKELIDLEQASHRRSLSDVVKYRQSSGLTIEADGSSIAYPDGMLWSAVPKLVTTIIRGTTWMQRHTENWEADIPKSADIFTKDSNGNDQVKHVQLTSWFNGEGGAYALKTERDTGLGSEDLPDRSLIDMFDLIFHGTIEDIHKPSVGGGKVMQMTDARFKNGFFVNPDIVQKGEVITIDGDDKKAVFYTGNTDPSFFTVDVDMRHTGVSLNLDVLLSDDFGRDEIKPTTPTKKEGESFETAYPKGSELLARANEFDDLYSNDIAGLNELINDLNKSILNNLYNKAKSVSNLKALFNSDSDSLYILPDSGDVMTVTPLEYIELLFGKKVVDYMSTTDKVIFKFDDNSECYLMKNGTLTESEETTETKKPVETKKSYWESEKYDGETLIDYINKIDFGDSVDSDLVESFKQTLNDLNLLEISDEEKANKLRELFGDEFEEINDYLSDNYDEYYEKLIDNNC